VNFKSFFAELKRRNDPRFEALVEKMFAPHLKHLRMRDD
jgi:hypothetical protein